MNILLVSSGDNGGGCWFLAQAINRHTKHRAQAIRMMQSWIEYPYDLLNPSQAKMEELCRWADVIHGRDTRHFLPDSCPQTPTVLTYTGASYRKKFRQIHPYCRERGWVVSVSTPDMLGLLRADGLPELWMPQAREDVSGAPRRRHNRFTVAHAPTMRNRKGTETVIAALGGLPDVDLELIEQTPYAECLERKSKCHALIDQFLAGYGNNAIEAWAAGLPVISGATVAEWTQNIRDLYGGEMPYLSASEDMDEIREAVERLRTDPAFYEEAVERGRGYYLRYHCPEAAAKRALELYAMAMDAKPPRRQGRGRSTGKPQKKAAAPAIVRNAPLHILSLGTWDYGACGYFLAQAINETTPHESRAVRFTESLFDYPYDLLAPPEGRLLKLWRWADVVHIHDGTLRSVLAMPPKPTVITWHGSRFRAAQAKNLQAAKERGWLPTVATLDLTKSGVRWMPDCRPALAGYVSAWHRRREFAACHAPTKRDVKGTEVVIKAMEGLPLMLIENEPWRGCLALKGRAKVTIDQFRLGYGCNAIEAWTMDAPVIGGGSAIVEYLIRKQMGFLPFAACGEDAGQIRETFLRLRDDRAFFAETLARGKECYNTFHSPVAAARQALAYYREALDLFAPSRRAVRIEERAEPGRAGMPLLRYTGGNNGVCTFFGEVTGTQYKFSKKHDINYVYAEDAPALLRKPKHGRAEFVLEEE